MKGLAGGGSGKIKRAVCAQIKKAMLETSIAFQAERE
jgi:hypothetical protein